ncbi:hypothetical protein ACFL3H_02150 [Gemmatimonadota bacterium]
MLRRRGPVKAPPSGRTIRLLKAILLPIILLVTGCDDNVNPRREEIDGIEYVRNRSRPADGNPLPAPAPPLDLIMVEGSTGDFPSWSAIRDVRAVEGIGWAVVDMHRTEVIWFDNTGGLLATMDLSQSGLDLTSPVAMAFTITGEGVCVDMALRRALTFSADGARLSSFQIDDGLPMDLDIGPRGDIYVLTSSHPDDGREHLLQVRRFGAGGAPLKIAGNDSLLIEHHTITDPGASSPMSISVSPQNTLYTAGRDYMIHQVLTDGTHRVITRPTIESRIPDPVIEQQRSLMRQRVSSQQRQVTIMETLAIVQVIALDSGGVLVQTNEWHPSMLDAEISSRSTILLLDQFSEDGVFQRRHAVELPTPHMLVHITDETEGYLYGYAVPATGGGQTSIFRFHLSP